VAEDQERFRNELEAWRSEQSDEGLAAAALFEEASGRKKSAASEKNSTASEKKSAAPKPRPEPKKRSVRPSVPRKEFIRLQPKAFHEQTMTYILQGASNMIIEEQQARLRVAANLVQEQRHEQFRPLQAAGSLPSTPQQLPQAEPSDQDTSVDDLLGDLMMVESEQADAGLFGGAEAPGAAQGGGYNFGSSRSWNETPQVARQPQALGPQLCLDESGNIVLNQTSLLQNLTEDLQEPIEEEGVQEAVSQYASAYRRTPLCKWTHDENEMFYEALRIYGTDLFLIQTFFRNKSAAQIKNKYQKELKKNPEAVEQALTSQSMKLTKDTFEKLHGKIDTSKHYKPPPSPEGVGAEEQAGAGEAEDDEPQDDDDGMPPPEPEFSAEDESLTTNRLMALFD